MSISVAKVFNFVLLLLALSWSAAQASERRIGAFALTHAKGAVDVAVLGHASELIQTSELPRYFSGLLRSEFGSESETVWMASNGLELYQQGTGFLGVERFEQNASVGSDLWDLPKEKGQSRMVFYLRFGDVVFDTRALAKASRVSVELPMGQISDEQGLWSVEIEKQERKDSYRFTIQCYRGTLRFTDHLLRTYELWAGQGLIGAGLVDDPTVTMGALTARDLRQFERARSAFDVAGEVPLQSSEGLKCMALITSLGGAENQSSSVEEVPAAAKKRSIFIEYIAPSAPLVPFRGVREVLPIKGKANGSAIDSWSGF